MRVKVRRRLSAVGQRFLRRFCSREPDGELADQAQGDSWRQRPLAVYQLSERVARDELQQQVTQATVAAGTDHPLCLEPSRVVEAGEPLELSRAPLLQAAGILSVHEDGQAGHNRAGITQRSVN